MARPYLISLILCLCIFGEIHAQAPVISSFSPTSGPVGSTVIINGSNFDALPSNDLILFGKAAATIVSASGTQIVAKVPPGAGYNTVNITNLTTGLTGNSTQYFDLAFKLKNKMTSSNLEVTTTIPVPYNQSKIAYGDLDGDGKPDLAIVNPGGTTISVFRNIEPGTNINLSSFDTKIDLTIPKNSYRVEILDLDGDGKPEIIISTGSINVNNNGGVTIYKNNSVKGVAFTTASFQRFDLPFSVFPDMMGVADIDGDGKPDIVMRANVGASSNIVVLKNNALQGKLNASSFTETILAPGSGTQMIVTDMDGDGKPDIITSQAGLSTVNILQNKGNLIFTSTAFNIIMTTGGIAVGDINGDGKPDLLVTGYDEDVLYLYQNTSTPGILSASSFSLQSKTFCGRVPTGVKVADLDGDGKPDIALVNTADKTVCIFKNIYNSTNPSAPWIDSKLLLDLGVVPDDLQVADLNNDGLPDLLISDNAPSATLIKNEPVNIPVIKSFAPIVGPAGSVVTIIGKNFTTNASNVKVYFGYRPAQVQSINDSTIQAIVPVGTTHCQLSVAIASIKRKATSTVTFNGTFPAKKTIESSDFNLALYVPMPGNLIRFSDLDGDGFVDLIYIDNTNGQIGIQQNIGQAKRIDCTLFTKVLSLADPIANSGLSLADINNDGQPDIIVEDGNTVGYYINTSTKGNIQFAAYQSFSGSGGQLLDIDGDGRVDFATSDHIYRNATTENSSGIELKGGFALGGTSTTGFTVFQAISDANSDGRPDLFTNEGTSGALTVRENQSYTGYLCDSSFSVPMATGITSSGGLFITDIDADGKPDILKGSTFYKNTSAGSVISYQAGVPQFPSTFDFVSDLNGDGEPDFATEIAPASGNIDTLVLHQNHAVLGQEPSYNSSVAKFNYGISGNIVGNTAQFIAVEDLNNDNKPDMIYFDSAGSRLLIFENVTASVDTDAAPTVTSFTPQSGNIGGTVTLTGSNFNLAVANSNVYFGNIPATVTAASTTQLTVQVPAGAVYGPVVVNDKITKLSASSAGSFAVAVGSGKGVTLNTASFGSQLQLLSGIFPNNFAVADLNNDGKYELVVLNSSPSIWIYSSSSTDQFNNPTNFTHTGTLTTGTLSNHLLIADLDGDGKPEIINTDGQGIRIFQNNSSVTCGFSFIPTLLLAGTLSSDVAVADINGDGKPDLLTIYNGVLRVLINTSKRGSISFQPYQTHILPTAQTVSENYVFVVTDFNGDGKPDIIVDFGSSGNPTVLLQNMGGTPGNPVNFAPAIQLGFSNASATIYNGVMVKDVDGDGKPDLLVLNHANSSLDVYKNLSVSTGLISSSSIASKVSFKIPIAPDNMSVGDFDGDGEIDVVLGSLSDTVSYVLQNTANTGVIDNSSFGSPVKILTHSSTFISSVVDFNRDGVADLMVLSKSSLGVLQNNAPVPLPVITPGGPTTFTTGNSVTLTASPGSGFTYQWLKDGVPINGATSSTYTATLSGAYTVSISLGNVTHISASSVAVAVVFALPATNFKLTLTSVTCHGNNDGSVNITAVQNLNYTATIVGNGLNTPYAFATALNINNLAAGTYNLCITVAGQPNYSQCYSVVITQPQDLSVYSTINPDNSLTLTLSGGYTYNIQFNGELYTTTNNSITLPLAEGNNDISVTTDRLCQGTFQKVINISGKMTPYPDPFQNTLNINLGNSIVNRVAIEMHSVNDGKLIYSRQYVNQSGVLQLDVSALENGVYALHLSMDNQEKVFKVIKK